MVVLFGLIFVLVILALAVAINGGLLSEAKPKPQRELPKGPEGYIDHFDDVRVLSVTRIERYLGFEYKVTFIRGQREYTLLSDHPSVYHYPSMKDTDSGFHKLFKLIVRRYNYNQMIPK